MRTNTNRTGRPGVRAARRRTSHLSATGAFVNIYYLKLDVLVMMKNRCLLLSLGLIVFAAVSIGAVSASIMVPPEDTGRVLTVIDDFGETVTIQGIPQRIVSLAPSNTEILFAIGLEDRIVGVTDYCDYPPAAAGIQKIGGYSTISIEKVLAADPNLIIAAPGNTEDVVNRLRDLGMTVITLNPETIDDVLRDIALLGEVTGQEEQASACVESLQLRINTVTEKTDTLTKKPTAVHVVWHDPIWISGSGTFQDEVIAMAGGVNAFGSVDGWGIVSLEEFIVADPDYILVSSGTGMTEEEGHDVIKDYFMNEPRMQGLKSVRDGHIYVIDADVISRGGPRIVDALEEVATILAPDLFGVAPREAASATSSPGFGVIPLISALLVLFLFRVRR